ncbi:hypothetical protein [Tropicimonas sp. IMCC6043]|uniref:hypothetical protein n=1 Tax=Tropicimonas sp. IMCC6043 TaxID=2510645 RepID=UPI00101D77ED|nr:hypothetical protein [Tropicimonas sp. IMCC6043]RYH08694.1 hypothetical protein EU800_15710 [Tropicimonas sp. IMCC6043]
MFKTLSAATLSIALAATSLAPTPALAGSRDEMVPVVIGLGLLAAAAAVTLNERERSRNDWQNVFQGERQPTTSRRRAQAPAYVEQPRFYGPDRGQRARRALPEYCTRRLAGSRGNREVLMQRCLENSGVRTGWLPDRCERRVDLPGRRATAIGWSANCLRREGYAIR